ncbi:vitamin K epoxide reductase family protein [Microbacterium sp. SORGH_AS_0888]|uniref:vitamin K epoxide reductase family protein n=1 Tax=Microbacterium sp. SORGH_AS_0888 TaxID=3041791 RepID=UPI002782FA94|nr:vitamin K epoxide reductase family protein [Microbacterium sp. SORGH_AS_0888]MDQ1128689.1 putative membrane protein [Microbacterium sp. SORGH_AS_0888]
MPDAPAPHRSPALAILLIVGGLLGLLASFSLTMDDIALLQDPNAGLSCNVNAYLQCGKNIGSWQGSVFGFPNPILGLMTFPAPVAVGVALLARARFSAWFWWLFNAGLTFAICFVFWLAFESIFDIRTLCPWCALVYLVVIPMWTGTTVRNLAAGLAGPALARVGRALVWWVPLISLAGYIVIFGAAQLNLDILGTLF